MSILQSTFQEIEKVVDSYPHKQGAVLPILHKLQEQYGYLEEDVLAELAEYLGMPQVDLFEIATFYTLLHTAPCGENIILACNNISCYLLGAETVLSILEDELNIKSGHTTEDKKFTLQTVSCLGACDKGPVMLINDKLYSQLTKEKIKQILKEY